MECENCPAIIAEPDSIIVDDGSTVCQACCDRYYQRCHGCDGYFEAGSECSQGCCHPDDCDCDDCIEEGQGLVKEYSYSPIPVFRGTGPVYLGAEIEISTPWRRDLTCARHASAKLGDLGYLKADASIDNGFEMVTHPMSYPWAISNFPWQMLTDLRLMGCEATDSTGIHVHISRAGFNGPSHTFRWMKFIYRNERQVTILARRSSPRYAAFTDDDRRAVKRYAKGSLGERYRAINTRNDDTFELRIFASSLDPDEVKAALAFADASVEYTRALTVQQIAGGAWTWKAFVAWLAEQPDYEPLLRQLEALECVC